MYLLLFNYRNPTEDKYLQAFQAPTASACGRCPDHVRDYYVTQYYIRLRLELLERLRSEMRERTFEEIMVRHRDALAKLNISLCKKCLLPIKLEEENLSDGQSNGLFIRLAF
ncbi:19312_t:CDS:2 [Rhizophagus irregularis]|nr:19312_t:CDS:2 [Rhizophagus irregularis]